MSDFEATELRRILNVQKTLVELWSLRGAPFIVPSAEAAVFTSGLWPDCEEAAQFLMRGAVEHQRRFGLGARQVIDITSAVLESVYANRAALTKDELGIALAEIVGRSLPSEDLEAWNTPDGLGKNTYGQSLVRYALSVVALSGRLCIIRDRDASVARLILTEHWLGHPLPGITPGAARAELVRCFLHFYGPGDLEGFVRWSGAAPEFARGSWDLITAEVIPVSWQGKQYLLLAGDQDLLAKASPGAAVRLLPPHDPFLSAPDREVLVPDRRLHPRLWRITTNPGAVLAGGEVVGLWRPQKTGDRLYLRIEPFQDFPKELQAEIEPEAEQIARLRGARLEKIEYIGN